MFYIFVVIRWTLGTIGGLDERRVEGREAGTIHVITVAITIGIALQGQWVEG